MLIEAIVIKKTATREHDQLVTLYCRQLGKTLATAKSIFKAHSVQALQLDEGNLIRCELVAASGAPIITGAQAERCFSSAKSSAVRWAAVSFFLQVVDRLVYDHQQDAELFEGLLRALEDLNEVSETDVLSCFRFHQNALLQVLGYGEFSQAMITSVRGGRTEMDDTYERIAQKRMNTLDLFYDLVNIRFS